jgi:hypothetical protein
MSDSPHKKEAYVSQRPPAQRSNVVRLRDSPGRAVEIMLDCDAIELQHTICEVLGLGYCVSFTATSDGGAVSIVVFDGYTRFKGYGRSAAHFETSIREVLRLARGEE